MTTIPLPLMRNSERNDFKQCPAKWNWRWNLGLVPAMPRQDARWFGTLWHLLWATVYTPPEGKDGFTRAITNPAEIHELWDKLTKDAYVTVSSGPYFDEDKEREYWDAIELGHFMIDGQLKKWRLDPGYEVLMPEQRFHAKIPYNARQIETYDMGSFNPRVPWLPTGKFICEGRGTFDLPIRDHTDGRALVRILDWKSTNRKDNLKQANKDDQIGMYIGVSTGFLRAAGLIPTNEAVQGAIWSFAKKAKPPDPSKVDDEGRVRNNPQKKHYLEALREAKIDVPGMDKFKIDDLASLANDAKIKVWGEVSARQGGPLFWREVIQRNKANRLRQISRIADDAEAIALVRSGNAPVTKNPAEHCNWCDYTDLCDIEEDGGDTEGFIRDAFKYEDPYADHREGAFNSKVIEDAR
jgi:PD-(D/E)XK nuclease superfamily